MGGVVRGIENGFFQKEIARAAYRYQQELDRNERVIVGHFSTRYNSRQVRNFVSKALPDMLGDRLYLWL